jgi:phosphonoacetaldehyde hydrolase
LSAEPPPVRLVVFDWAGTTVDHGCFGPLAAFRSAFADSGVAVSAEEARVPMGLPKRDHVAALLRLPAVARRWQDAHGRPATEADVDAIYTRFVPRQLDALGDHCRLVPGLLECVAALRARGVRVGATTGYFRAAADRVRAAAAAQGYVPDRSLCPDDVPAGRPAPWMIFRLMETLDVYPPAAVLKIGDTAPDMAEGRNAGAWCVGVTRTGSLVGRTEEEFAALPAAERQELLAEAGRQLLDAGAHVVAESVADLPALLARWRRRGVPA